MMRPDSGLDSIKDLVRQSSSRHDFISKLIQELNPGEVRRVFQAFAGRFLYWDILGNLPLEIVIEIILLLGPLALFRYRRVCKRWNTLLSSNDLANVCLRHFHGPDFAPLLGEAGTTASSLKFALREKYRLTVESRRPYTLMMHPVLSESSAPDLKSFEKIYTNDCYDGLFAWIVPTGDQYRECVRTFSLLDGTQSKIRAPDRSKVNRVRVMLGQVVVMITNSGSAFAVRMADPKMIYQRLPNAQIECMGGRGRYLCLTWPPRDKMPIVWIWDLTRDIATTETLQNWDSMTFRYGLSISDDGRQVASIERSPLQNYLYFSIHDLATGGVSTKAAWWLQEHWSQPVYDFNRRTVASDAQTQEKIRGLKKAVHHFLKQRPEFRDPFGGDLRLSGPEIPAWTKDTGCVVWGTSRLSLCIIALHPKQIWPLGLGAYYLFCVAGFDRDLELAGGQKSVLYAMGPAHPYW